MAWPVHQAVSRGPGAPPGQRRPRARTRTRPGRAAACSASAALAACTLAGALTVAGPAAGATAAGTRRAQAAAAASGGPGRPGWLPVRWFSTGRRRMAPDGRPVTPAPRAAGVAAGINGAVLEGVSCTSRRWCIATGMLVTHGGKTVGTLAEWWNGKAWSIQPTPTLHSAGPRGGALTAGVSCLSPTACVAAGSSPSKRGIRLLGEGWNGTKWTVQPTSGPARTVLPYRISCTWRIDCMVVGLRQAGRILAEHWNGRTWSPQATRRQGALLGVSCPASKDCAAVGFTRRGHSLAERWNGTTWAAQPTANPEPFSQLLSVSCRGTRVCMAVGTAGATSGTPLAEQWTGTTWSAVPVPDPAPAGSIAEFSSVSCPSATNCLAVGDYANAAGTTDMTLAARWDGTVWTFEPTPSPARFSGLVSVSCTSMAHCVAVGGRSATASGAATPLVESWNGSTWTVQAAPR